MRQKVGSMQRKLEEGRLLKKLLKQSKENPGCKRLKSLERVNRRSGEEWLNGGRGRGLVRRVLINQTITFGQCKFQNRTCNDN